MDFDPKKLRARFHSLTAKYDKAQEKLAPLRAKYDALSQKNRAAEDELAEDIRKVTEGLYDVEMERAAIARALGRRGLIEPQEG